MAEGGVSRAVSDMSRHWADRSHNVTVITYDEALYDQFPLDDRVPRIDLMIRRSRGVLGLFTVPRRILMLRGVLRRIRPDVAISMVAGANFLTVTAAAGLGIAVIGEEVTALDVRRRQARVRALRRLFYSRMHAFVVQSEQSRAAAERLVPAGRVHVIPRSVNPSFLSSTDRETHSLWADFPGGAPQVHIAALGGLHRHKGFDILLHSLAKISSGTSWGLIVMGEGFQRGALERLAAELRLESRVWFAGWATDPHPTLRESTLFAFPSRYEGFGQALIEAMACGLPVVAADCPTGPGEIITNGVDGLLVPVEDPDALAAAIVRLIDDPDLRTRLGTAALSVRDRYSLERVAAMWEALFPNSSQKNETV
jgi:glycosyltransferase involved in cell wall biosynthesis